MAVDTGHEEEGGTHFSIPVPFYVASHFQLPDRVTENTLELPSVKIVRFLFHRRSLFPRYRLHLLGCWFTLSLVRTRNRRRIIRPRPGGETWWVGVSGTVQQRGQAAIIESP